MKQKNSRKRHKYTNQTQRLYERVLPHPPIIFAFLCAGILLLGATLQSHAASYTITATVPAPLPMAPATITSHVDQQHVAVQSVVISGTCPNLNYIKLYDNDTLVGVASCNNNTFALQLLLTPGKNALLAKIYNSTNNEGPSSPTVTIFYDTTTPILLPQLSFHSPEDLIVISIDNMTFQNGLLIETSAQPTLAGFAPPYSTIIATYGSNLETCITKANGNGWWSCTVNQPLPPGIHPVDVQATSPDDKHLSVPKFYILVNPPRPSPFVQPPSTIPTLTITSEYRYQVLYMGQPWSWDIRISGGTPPYRLQVSWGDGQTTSQTGSMATYTMTHTYKSAGVYHPIFIVSDQSDQKASFQGLVMSRPEASASNSTSSLGDIRDYLWVILPSCLVILPLIVHFYLGKYGVKIRLMHGKPRSKQ